MRRVRAIALVHRHVPARDRVDSPGMQEVRRWWRAVVTSIIDPYRPERHYMRGPGPKWREKHRRSRMPGSD